MGVDPIRMTWPDFCRSECVYGGKRVSLPPAVSELLAVLMMNRGHTLTANQLIERLWPDPDIEPDWARGALRIRIFRLRQRCPALVETVGKNKGARGWTIPLPMVEELRLAA